jgi:NAD(P)-dependent dehydrogenase (short-subunit alcohol dehydrogenase family)
MYCTSKWAIEGWAEAVAYELAPFGIDVVLIEPGPYRTPIWQNSLRLIPPRSTYPPKEIAVVIATALEARRPRFRYLVGPIARFNHLLRGKVPIRLARKEVEWYLGVRSST